MINRESINWLAEEPICFVCRKKVNDIKCIAIAETLNNKGTRFDENCFKSIRICLSCWEDIAGEDWMFSE